MVARTAQRLLLRGKSSIVAIAWACGLAPAAAATLTCPNSQTLESLVTCISTQMPQDNSNGYVAPTATQRADFRTVFGRMLAGNCDQALPASLAANMQLRRFQDAGNGRDYCVLMEITDADGNGYVDKGWGTFITYAGAAREVAHQAPHPKLNTSTSGSLGDAYTESEAIRVFKQTDSRSFGMCGARRSANTNAASCQSSYRSSDCAHTTNNLLHASTEQLLAHYGTQDFTVIQWHAMASGTCNETAYMSHGYATAPSSSAKVTALRNKARLELPGWVISTRSDTSRCDLNATDNTQGRLLNGVAAGSVCGTSASSSGFRNRFIHVEQDAPDLGKDVPGVSSAWARAVVAALPGNTAASTSTMAVATAPSTPTSLLATAGDARVSLRWADAAGATSYRVKRSGVAGGPYSVVGTSTSTAFTDAGLHNGVAYHYVVSAVNAAGESADSAPASAVPTAQQKGQKR